MAKNPKPVADATPDETATTPAIRSMTVSGVAVELPEKFKEGMTLTGAQAGALNQVERENVRNNMAKRVKELLGEVDPSALVADDATDEHKALLNTIRTEVLDYANDYEFSIGSSGGGRSTDPLEREILSVAKSVVHLKIKTAGKKIKDFTPEKLADFYATASKAPAIVNKAKENLAERQKNAALAIGDLDFTA